MLSSYVVVYYAYPYCGHRLLDANFHIIIVFALDFVADYIQVVL